MITCLWPARAETSWCRPAAAYGKAASPHTIQYISQRFTMYIINGEVAELV